MASPTVPGTASLAALEQLPRTMVAIGVLGALVIAYLVRVALRWSRLSHVPGPFWAAFSSWWMVKESLKGRQPLAIKQVTDKYGKFCRWLQCECSLTTHQVRSRGLGQMSWSQMTRRSCAG